MATFSQNQVRDIIITTAEATESTAATFLASASNLESRVLKADGSAVPTAVGDILILNKRSNGDLKRSDIIKGGQATYLKKQAPVTAVNKAVTFTIPTGMATGTTAKIDISFDNWGSASFEDQYFKFAVYKTIAGDGVEQVINGLIKSLAHNFMREEPKALTSTTYNTYAVQASYADEAAAVADKGSLTNGQNVEVGSAGSEVVYAVTDTTETLFADIFTLVDNQSTFTVMDNPYFTFTKEGNGDSVKLKITDKDQQFVLGKKQARPLIWYATNDFEATQVETLRVVNPTSGQAIANLEWFCRGNFGDIYRGMGYPNNFETVYDANPDIAVGYYVIELGFYYQGTNHAVQKSEKQLTIAVSDKTVANALITDIEAGTGLTVGAFA